MKKLLFTLMFSAVTLIPSMAMAERACTYEALAQAEASAGQMNCRSVDFAISDNESGPFAVQVMCSSSKKMQFEITLDSADNCKVSEIKKVKLKAN